MQLRLGDLLPAQRHRIEVDEEELLNALQLQPVRSPIVPLHFFRVSRDPQIPRDFDTLLCMHGEGNEKKESEAFHGK